jgi:hypothetical protein
VQKVENFIPDGRHNDILGLATALRAATTIIKFVFVFVFSPASGGDRETQEFLGRLRLRLIYKFTVRIPDRNQAATGKKYADGMTSK